MDKGISNLYFSNADNIFKLAHQYLENIGWDHFARKDSIEDECFTKISCKIKEKARDIISGERVGHSKVKVTIKNFLVTEDGEGIPYAIISVKYKDVYDDKYTRINAADVLDNLTITALAIEAKYDYFESIREVGKELKENRGFNYIRWIEDGEHEQYEVINKIVNAHPMDVVLPITVHDLYTYNGLRRNTDA